MSAPRGRGGGGGGRGRGGGGPGGSSRGGDSSSGSGSRGSFRGRRPFESTSGSRGSSSRGGSPQRGGPGGFKQRAQSAPAAIFGNPSRVPLPDANVTKTENTVVKDLSTAFARISTEDKLARRPDYGTCGRETIVYTNYFPLNVATQCPDIYRYAVSFQPEENAKRKKRRYLEILLQEPAFQGVMLATDYSQIVITNKKVPLSEGTHNRKAFEIQWYPPDGEPIPESDESEKAQVARKKATKTLLVEELGTISLLELLNSLTSTGAGAYYPLKDEAIQALNVILARGPHVAPNMVAVGQNKFYPVGQHPLTEAWNLSEGLQALRGYFSSARTSVNRILVNINVSTSAFYKPGNLLELMQDYLGPSNRSPSHLLKLEAFLRLLRVETHYMLARDGSGKRIRKVKTIFGLARSNNDSKGTWPHAANAQQVRFSYTDPDGNVSLISVEEYYARVHKITLKVPTSPVVNVGNRDNPTYIPPELCEVLPGQVAGRMLSANQTRLMIEFAARPPNHNATSITQQGLEVMQVKQNDALPAFGINIGGNLLTVQARILPVPQLQYAGKVQQPENGKWNLARVRYTKPAAIQSWGCLVVEERGRPIFNIQEQALDLVSTFKSALQSYGLRMDDPQPPAKIAISWPYNPSEITEVVSAKFAQMVKMRIGMLLVLLPSDNTALYDTIKYQGDVRFGVATVCTIAKKILSQRGQAQYMANVGLKFNLKCGGVNHDMRIQQLAPLDNKTILIGIDVSHPVPGSSDSAPSITGVVGSVDAQFNNYPASIRTQTGRQEMVDSNDLTEMIVERFELWRKRNGGALPNKVIVYRDGVSEGQYPVVLREEWPSFAAAYKKLYGIEKNFPKSSLVICTKRGHTRFYPTKQEDSEGRNMNVKPGTVVDRGITGERLFDFFLVAHAGLQGTSKPAHYICLRDENKLGADQLQRITHNLCYVYGRATRAVSVCPPAYYADLVCERGRSYLHSFLKENTNVSYDRSRHWTRGVHDRLKDTMFYL
ncbi:argonaute-like protein [Botryosphaeria dothidea]|uniref:Argonaute-like protein n=1 Tax=Botryosphaeria dothidea TaxID=55169 RepID=A0A8H4J4H2_9PEZI|nr:argonaute-like protein [Botryosphaeria dothidea]